MVTLALIGAGKWGKNYLTAVNQLPKCRIKYVCTKDNDYRQLIKYPDVNGVIIATPAKTHYLIAKFFLSHGYPLLIEKPVAMNYAQAQDLERRQQRQKVAVMVGHTYLFHPAYVRLKQSLKGLGKIDQLIFKGTNMGPMPAGLSVLWEWGPHAVALAIDLLGHEPVGVMTQGRGEKVTLKLKFADKVTFQATLGWGFTVKERSLTVINSQGKAKQVVLGSLRKTQTPPLVAELVAWVRAIKDGVVPISDINLGVKVTKVLVLAEKVV